MRLLLALALVGCSSGGGQPTGDLTADANLAVGTWVAFDPASGTVAPISGAVDPDAAEWRTGRVLFRQIPAGEAALGRSIADLNAEDDEHPQRRIQVGRTWIAVNELSQRQWQILAGTRPWLTVLPVADPSPFLGDDLPAFGLSADLAGQALDRPLADGWLLDLPDADEWERACLAGATSKFAWGDGVDGAAGWAVCAVDCPLPVGGRQANAWGLHDLHGNVWELVRDGATWQVRGGAWDQPVMTARASNRLEIDQFAIGWNVGLRPVLRR